MSQTVAERGCISNKAKGFVTSAEDLTVRAAVQIIIMLAAGWRRMEELRMMKRRTRRPGG